MVRAGLLICLCLIMVMASGLSAQYYYCHDEMIPLSIDSTKVLIKFDNQFSPSSQAALLSQIERITSIVDDNQILDDFVCCSLSAGSGYNDFLDSLDPIAGIYLVEPYYLDQYGYPIPVGEQFIVAFELTLTSSEIDSINAELGAVMDHLIYGFESIYVLRNTDSSGMRVLDLANYYCGMSNTHFAHPEFGMKYELSAYTLYDWYHPQQDHLKKVIGEFNQKSVWDFAGWDNAVTVAVIDDGVMEHEDLPESRILPGYDYINHSNDPTPVGEDGHGMGCAGIIAASHSTTPPVPPYTYSGVASFNPNVDIMPLKIFEGDYEVASNAEIASAFNWAFINGADIVSNSWGKPLCAPVEVIDTAILRLYKDGRNGLGTPIIFSSGNLGDYFAGVGYPACNAFTLAVGAIQLNDERWYYSQYGSHLDVVAPSGDYCLQGDLWTLDRMDYGGFNDLVDSACGMPVSWNCPYFQSNDVDYNCHFGGTSGACPAVSGIASLLIARKPDLHVDSIYRVLKYSAVTDLDWGSIDPPDNYYGWGRVDAYRAMLAITRGDANNDGTVNNSDAVYIIDYIFKGGPEPKPDKRTADANCDADINIGDANYIINYIFKGGPAPQICFEYDY